MNTLRPRLNRRPFADDILKCIFLNENEWILPRIWLKFVPKVRIDNIPALVQIMAWRRLGDKPLSEPIMASLLTHICVTRPQWANLKSAYYIMGVFTLLLALIKRIKRNLDPHYIVVHVDVQLQRTESARDCDGLSCTRIVKYVTNAP